MKKILIIILACLISGCGKNEKEGEKYLNNSYVSRIIIALKYHKSHYGKLPDSIEDVYNYGSIKDIVEKREVLYDKEGYKDQSNKKWIVVLIDNNSPDICYVGSFNDISLIRKDLFGYPLKPSDKKGTGSHLKY